MRGGRGGKAGGGPRGTRASGKLTGEGLTHLVTKGPETATLTGNWVFSPQMRAIKPHRKSYPSRSAPQLKTLCSKLEGERCGGQ